MMDCLNDPRALQHEQVWSTVCTYLCSGKHQSGSYKRQGTDNNVVNICQCSLSIERIREPGVRIRLHISKSSLFFSFAEEELLFLALKRFSAWRAFTPNPQSLVVSCNYIDTESPWDKCNHFIHLCLKRRESENADHSGRVGSNNPLRVYPQIIVAI